MPASVTKLALDGESASTAASAKMIRVSSHACVLPVQDALMRSSLVLPEPLEPIRGQLRVPCRVLNIPVPEVVLNRPRVVPVIGELVPAGVTQHVGMNRKAQPSLLTRPRHELPHRGVGERSVAVIASSR